MGSDEKLANTLTVNRPPANDFEQALLQSAERLGGEGCSCCGEDGIGETIEARAERLFELSEQAKQTGEPIVTATQTQKPDPYLTKNGMREVLERIRQARIQTIEEIANKLICDATGLNPSEIAVLTATIAEAKRITSGKPWAAKIEAKKLWVYQFNGKRRLQELKRLAESNGEMPDREVPTATNIIDYAETKSGLPIGNLMAALLPKYFNGFTIAIDDRGNVGVAMCSRKDEYSKQRGLQIAYNRLMKIPWRIFYFDEVLAWCQEGREEKRIYVGAKV